MSVIGGYIEAYNQYGLRGLSLYFNQGEDLFIEEDGANETIAEIPLAENTVSQSTVAQTTANRSFLAHLLLDWLVLMPNKNSNSCNLGEMSATLGFGCNIWAHERALDYNSRVDAGTTDGDVDADGDEEVDTDEPTDAEADADEVSDADGDADEAEIEQDADQEVDADPEDLGFCNTAPSGVTLLEPLDGDTVRLTPDLLWAGGLDGDTAIEDGGVVDDLVTYTVIVAASREFLQALLDNPETLRQIRDGEIEPEGAIYYETNISGTRSSLPELASGTPHYWIVLAHDLCNDTDHIVSSPINSFTTIGGCDINIAPATFDLIGPAETDTELRPLFEWNPANDPGDTIRYRVEISANPRFLEPDSSVVPDIVYERNSDGSYITANNFRPDSPLAVNTPYYWRVVAIDACGAERVSSNGLSFTTIESCELNEPTDFFLSGPGDIELGTERLGLSPEFTWEESVDGDVGDSITYHFYLVRVDGYGTAAETEMPVWDDTTTATRYSLEGRFRLRNDAVYRWHVTAEDACGNPAESINSFYFQTIRACSTPPYGLTLIEPSGMGDGGEGYPVDDITLSWNPADEDDLGDTVYYDVYLIDTVAGRTVFHERTTDTFVNLGLSLRYGTRYRWYVRASDDCGNTTESEALTFDTIRSCDLSDPLPFSLSRPPNGELDVSIRPRLEWDPSATGTDPDDAITGYEVEIATDEEFSDAIPYDAGLNTFYALTEAEALERGRTYFWRVYAIDECGNRTASSEVFSFTTRETAICERVGDEVRVTEAAGNSQAPTLVWTGTEFAVSWVDTRLGNSEIYLARIRDGVVVPRSEVSITGNDGYNSYASSLVWTGSGYGLCWVDDRHSNPEIYCGNISITGDILEREVRVTNTSGRSWEPSLVWNGIAREYGVSWMDEGNSGERFMVYFSRISEAIAVVGEVGRVTDDVGSYALNPALVWSGSEYALSWRDNREAGDFEIFFRRLSWDGIRLGPDVRFTDHIGSAAAASLSWTGREYGVAWQEHRRDPEGDNEIYIARISTIGERVGGPDLRITDEDDFSSSSPALIWSDGGYGLAWQDYRHGNFEIYFANVQFDEAVARLGPEVRVTTAAGDSQGPSLAWTGDRYGVAWQDARHGNNEIYFRGLACTD